MPTNTTNEMKICSAPSFFFETQQSPLHDRDRVHHSSKVSLEIGRQAGRQEYLADGGSR